MPETRASDHREWLAWEGGTERLQAIAEAVARACAEPFEASLEEARREHTAQLRAIAEGDYLIDAESHGEWVEEQLEAATERSLEHWTVEATARERELDYRRTGPAGDVIASLDPARVDSFELSVPNGASWLMDRIEVSLSKEKGARLYVAGRDRDWVRTTLALVGDEIARDVPRHAFLRRDFVPNLVGVGLAWAAFIALASDTPDPWTAIAQDPWALITLLLVSLVAVFSAHRLLKAHVITGFEIVTGHPRSRSVRALLATASFLLALAGSYLVGRLQG